MVYHLFKTIFYLFFLFIGHFSPCLAKIEGLRLNQEMAFLKKYASSPFMFLPEEENIDQVSTKQAAPKRTDKKVNADTLMEELEEETGPFKALPIDG